MNLVVWNLENKHLVSEGVQKPTCHRCRDSVDFRVDFACLLVALGPVFMTFGALEIGLKSDDFSWLSWGGAGLREHTHWVISSFHSGPPTLFANKTSSYNAVTVYKATKLSKLQDWND